MTVVQIEDAPRCTTWTHEEEITLCKGWVHVSKNSFIGNARKADGFGLRAHASGARDKDYFSMALLDNEVEYGVPFTLRHCWELVQHGVWDASINLNVDARDDDEDDAQELQRPIGRDKAKGSKKKGARSSRSSSSMNDEALARLMVSELVMHNERAIAMKKEERTTFLETRKREVEYRERELAIHEYKQCQKDIRLPLNMRGGLIKSKGNKAMSHKDAKEEESETDFKHAAKLTGSIVESSKKKHLKKFDFINHVNLIEE
nr:hypothetical protein [Tanacetum cinerariifolium]